MTKMIVPKLFLLLTFLISAIAGQSQDLPCNNYESDKLIIEIYEGALAPNEIGGTQAFTNYGGIDLDVIIGETYTIHLVQFNLPNAFFSDIEDAQSFYECGGGSGIDPLGNIVKIKKSDFNYIINNTTPTQSGASYDYTDYQLYGNCFSNDPFTHLPTSSTDTDINSPINIAFVDSGHVPGTPFDDIVSIDLGYDFANDDDFPIGPDPHGTYVSSVTAGMAYNNMDRISFIPVQILDENGDSDLFTFYKGFNYAVDQADIINLSVGAIMCEADYLCSVVFDDMLLEAEENDKLVIAAAGNDGVFIDNPIITESYYHIPSSSPGENLIVVGSSTCLNEPSDFSNKSQYNVDLLATGEDIIVYPNALASGTSFSAPQVTALAGVMLLNSPKADFRLLKCSILENSIYRDWSSVCLTGASPNYNHLYASCSNNSHTIGTKTSPIIDSKEKINIHISGESTISIKVEAEEEQEGMFKVYDLSGRTIKTKKLAIAPGKNEYNLTVSDINSLPAGLYFISLYLNNDITTYKWLKS